MDEKESIPIQLQQPDFRFVLLKPKEKIPFEAGWQNKIYKFDDDRLLNHIKEGGNYGVIGGGEKYLVIVDFDNEEVQNELVEKLPKTFTVKTGSGLLHKYLISTGSKSFKIFDKDLNTLADVQGEGKQVVGAGSVHPNGNTYEIVDESEVAFIDYSELKALIIPYDKKPKKEFAPKKEQSASIGNDDLLDKVKSSISLIDVLEDWGVDTSKNPTNCPLHSSKGGKCLGFNDKTAHCFHCDQSWNLFQVVQEHKKCNFKEALDYLVSKAGLEDEHAQSKKDWVNSKKIKDYGKDKDIIENKNLPEIILPHEGKSISRFSLEIIELLKNKNVLFYRPRINEIVEVGNIKIKDKDGKEKIITGFLEIKPQRFVTLLEKFAIVGIETYNPKWKQFEFKEKSILKSTAEIVLASQIVQEGLPQINRIFKVPIPIMYKGELTFPKKGYDPRFNSWLPFDAPEIKDMNLGDAKELINEIFKEFCFNKENYQKNKDTAIAALLTPSLRGLYTEWNVRTPLICYLANRERAGKDCAAGVTSIIYEGEDIQDSPISTGEKYGNTNEELRKKYTGALMAGRTRMHFSNCKGDINNSVFENILTNPVWTDRKMTVNTILSLSNEMDFSLSGNAGITYTRDLAERSRFIKLFYAEENINERKFERKDLHEWVKKNRSEILSALYALVKNWVDNGSKPGSLPFTSFPEWAGICGGIMEAAGYTNPCVIDKDNEDYGGDIEKDNMKQIFEICYEDFPNKWVQKEEIIRIVRENDIYPVEQNVEKSKFMINFRKYKGRVFSNIRLVIDDTLKKTTKHSFKFISTDEKIIKNNIISDEDRMAYAEEEK